MTGLSVDCWWRHWKRKCAAEHMLPFDGLLSGTTRVGQYQRKHSSTHTNPAVCRQWKWMGHRNSSVCQYIHTQPSNGVWSGTTPVGRYQKKHSPTHTHTGHRTSFVNFLHLLRSIASSVQFTCLTVLFDNLSPGPLWSSSLSWTLHFILHAFLHPIIIFFSQHMPIPTQPVLLQIQCYVIYT